MKIAFIRPNMSDCTSKDALEPLVFALLKGLTPSDVACELYDERIEPLPMQTPADLVAMTVETYTARRAYQIAQAYRERNIPVVMGGHHPTFCQKEALNHATSIVVGDAENVWRNVLEDARNDKLQRIYHGDNPELNNLRFDRGIFLGKRYRPLALVQFGRGCPHHCDFCSIHAFYGNSIRHRPVVDVVEEIRGVRGKHIFFTDDNLLAHPGKARELLNALTPLRVKWTCQIDINAASDSKFVDLMARSGCVAAIIGFETLSEENLTQMGKRWNSSYGLYDDLIERLHKHGIMIYGTFVFGYDADTIDSFAAAADFAVRNRMFLANFNPLTPTPGTKFYQRMLEEKRLLYHPWWLEGKYTYGTSTFRPDGMTADELTEGCFHARRRFYSLANIARRAGNRKANSKNFFNGKLFLSANLISRHEIIKKQGQRLGG